MPPRYYAVRETDSYADVTLHADRDCIDGPARAAPPSVSGDACPACTDAAGDPDDTDMDAEDTAEADDDSQSIEQATTQELIDNGGCPWCSEYEGEHVGRHASSAHPEAWAEHKS